MVDMFGVDQEIAVQRSQLQGYDIAVLAPEIDILLQAILPRNL
jgi:hypothetical protein